MDHRKLFYKSNNRLQSPDTKRKAAKEVRANKRTELYSSTRNIPEDDQKENTPCSKITEKESRQKAFIMRFMAWKAEKAKKTQQKMQTTKRPPFVVSTAGAAAAVEARNSKKPLAPTKQIFEPPINLNDLKIEKTGVNSVRCVSGSQVAKFEFVATPKKKQPALSKVAPGKSYTNASAPRTNCISVQKFTDAKPRFQFGSTKNTPAPAPQRLLSTASSKKQTPAAVPKPLIKEGPTPAPQVAPTTASRNKTPAPSTAGKPKSLPFSQSAQKSAVKRELKPSKTPIRPTVPERAAKPIEKPQTNMRLGSKMPPPSKQALKSRTTTKSGLPPIKRPTFKAAKKSNTSVSNALRTVKGLAPAPKLKLNGNTLLQISKLTDPVPETPTEVNPSNSMLTFVTSTKRKSVSSKDSNLDLLFTAELGDTISPVDNCSPIPVEQNSKQKSDKKFNFVRYSIVLDESKFKPTEPAKDDHKTPDKTDTPPTTYMSPYVSVSRGKVSKRVEKEKRNSIYMSVESKEATPDKNTVVRRTLATVHYYRKQLMDEIARLNELSSNWEQYKEANAQLLEDGGVDMINVTIGQTKLLTTKKLKQFGGLIDRCEDGVMAKSTTSNGDGGEGAKPILPEDLEGFWSMVCLQIENIDKRFVELERWKANNWADPDDVQPAKPTNNAKKTKTRKPLASTARPNGALQKMLRTAHAAYLKKKAVGGADEDVILTPSKSRQVLIKDRRSRSAAATVITVNTPRTSRTSSAHEAQPSTDPQHESPKLVQHINLFRSSMNLLKRTLVSEQEKKSPVSPLRNPSAFRKSILKTPGSRSRPKSVIFNSPKLKFTYEDTIDDTVGNGKAASDEYQAEDQRAYKLRNRRIILRDSAEFVIPK